MVDDEPIVLDVVTRYLEHDGHSVVYRRDRRRGAREDRGLAAGSRPARRDASRRDRRARALPLDPLDLGAAGDPGDRARQGIGSHRRPGSSAPTTTSRSRSRRVSSQRACAPFCAGSGRAAPPRTSVAVGPLAIDATNHEVLRDGEPLQLTAARVGASCGSSRSNPNRVFSRDQLMHRVWGYWSALDTGTVTVHMRRLREKVETRSVQPAPARDRVGCRLQAGARATPARRSACSSRALVARGRSACRSRVVLSTGWVMLGIHDEGEDRGRRRCVCARRPLFAVLLASRILRPLERLRKASVAARRRRPGARVRSESGPRELVELSTPLLQRDGLQHRAAVRRPTRARRLGQSRPPDSARVARSDGRGDRGRARCAGRIPTGDPRAAADPHVGSSTISSRWRCWTQAP